MELGTAAARKFCSILAFWVIFAQNAFEDAKEYNIESTFALLC
jgi:hypothetical protein